MLTDVFSLAVPLILASVGIYAALHGVNIFTSLMRGAGQGLATVRDMLPPLIIMFPAVYMLRASGALDALARLLEPALSAVGIPAEVVPLALIRPLSGGAATAAVADIINKCGANSLAGRTAAVMLGSSETTFYVIAVYFGAAKIKNTRCAVPAALLADLAVFLTSAWTCKLFWG